MTYEWHNVAFAVSHCTLCRLCGFRHLCKAFGCPMLELIMDDSDHGMLTKLTNQMRRVKFSPSYCQLTRCLSTAHRSQNSSTKCGSIHEPQDAFALPLCSKFCFKAPKWFTLLHPQRLKHWFPFFTIILQFKSCRNIIDVYFQYRSINVIKSKPTGCKFHIPPLFHQHFTTVVNQRAREPPKHSTSLTLASCRKMAMGQSWGPLLRSQKSNGALTVIWKDIATSNTLLYTLW